MKINLILLASGNSRRFNGNKLLAEFQGKPLAMHIINKVLELPFNKVVLITQYDKLIDLVKYKNITTIRNNEPNKGISNSIKLGIKESLDAEAYMFMVCDQPFITKKTLLGMIELFKESAKNILSAAYNDEMGNPTIFSSKYMDELNSLEGDVGGRKIIKNHMNDLEKYYVKDNIELMDIDTRYSLRLAEAENLL